MSHRVRKCADSVDPRDWHYLSFWQRWGTFMPPWNWEFHAPLTFPAGSAPLFGKFQAFERSSPIVDTNFLGWEVLCSILIPDVGDIPILEFGVTLECFNPDSPPVDPITGPFTVKIDGLIFSLIPGFTILAPFAGKWLKPAYNTEFVMPIHNFSIGSVIEFDGFITMRPCIWNAPTLP